MLENTGDFAGAFKTLQRAQPFMQAIAISQNDPKMQDRLGGLYYYMGDVLEKSGDSRGALENYRKAASIHGPLNADQRASVFTRVHAGADYYGMARTFSDTGRNDDALQMAEKGLAVVKQLSTPIRPMRPCVSIWRRAMEYRPRFRRKKEILGTLWNWRTRRARFSGSSSRWIRTTI